MKNNKKLILLLVLSIFLVGMLCGTATASHTFSKKGYKVTVSDEDYDKIKNGKLYIDKKVDTKTTKTWVTKKVKVYQAWKNSKGKVYKTKAWNPYKQVGSKAKYIKAVTQKYKGGAIVWQYFKVPKTVKKNVYFHIGANYDFGKESFTGKIYTIVDTNKYCVF